MANFKVDFAGFEEMREKLNKLGADTKKIAEDALYATYDTAERYENHSFGYCLR